MTFIIPTRYHRSPERLYEADIHGAGYISTKRMLGSSGNRWGECTRRKGSGYTCLAALEIDITMLNRNNK